MYKSTAYRRNDSSTVEMDLLELHRAILKKKHDIWTDWWDWAAHSFVIEQHFISGHNYQII